MAKPRVHVTMSENMLKYANGELPKFNDSLSSFICYCINLYKTTNESQQLGVQPQYIVAQPQVMAQNYVQQPQAVPKPEPIEEPIDEETLSSVMNILNLK